MNPVPWLGVGLVFLLQKIWPQSFQTLFLLNVWFFSMPHTFSTFTRSDRKTTKNFAVTLGLWIFFATLVTFTAQAKGMVIVYSFYFLWQQYHYSKQNYGLARKVSPGLPWWYDQLYYVGSAAVIISALLSDGPQNFFGYLLQNPLPFTLTKTDALLLVAVLGAPYVCFRKGLLPALEHAAIFSISYLYTEHFALGWLFLNVFHNLQYLSFMKMVERKLTFFAWPLGLTAFLYLLQHHAFGAWVIPAMLALNFTHYTLDGFIWRRASTT